MTKNHLKRNFANKRWNLLRKIDKFILKPLPGKHSIAYCVALGWVLKRLGVINTTREGKKVLQINNIQLDKIRVKNVKQPVGVMDVVSINEKDYRCIFDNKGRIDFVEIDAADAAKKICKIINKNKVKKGKTQLNFIDGRNIIIEKDDFKVGDSVVLELPSQKILKHLPFTEGSIVILTSGKNAGRIGKIRKILDHHILYNDEKGAEFATLKKYGFVIGLEKLEIKIL